MYVYLCVNEYMRRVVSLYKHISDRISPDPKQCDDKEMDRPESDVNGVGVGRKMAGTWRIFAGKKN